jgi:GTPase-associated system-like protein
LKVAIPDLPSAQKAIQQLETQITDLERNAAMDREEISLFWFMATGFSTRKGQPFVGLPVSVAAVHAALDVSRFVLAPVPLNCFEILKSIVESKRKAEECEVVELKDQIAHWSADEWQSVSRSDSLDEQLAVRFPVVFPMTWIATRMREADSQPNWAECKRKTRLRGEAKLSASAIARQLLSEKIAVSIASEIIG